MKLFFILAIIGIPSLEIFTFIKVGGVLGVWPTIGLVFVTALIGLSQLNSQGTETLYKAMETLCQNRFPIDELFNGVCLILAGILLLTPGFITDFVGFLFLIPFIRIKIRQSLANFSFTNSRVHINHSDIQNSKPTTGDPMTIEGEYDDLTATREEK